MGEGGDAAAHQWVPVEFVQGQQADLIEQPAAEVAQLAGGAEGGDAVAGEQRLRPGAAGRKEGAQAVAEEVVGLQDLALERRSPADGGIEGLDPLDPRAGAVERFGDQQDVAEAAVLQVVEGLFDGVGVVQADQVGIQLGQLAVHQHHRQFAVQGAQFAGMVAEGVHDQSFDVVGLQGGQVMTLLLVVAVGIAHHQAVAVFAAGGFHAMHDGHGVGVEDVRHQHSDQPCAPALEASGHLVGAVVELVDGALDAPGGGIGEQLAVAADIARHASLGDAGGLGHLVDGDAATAGQY